MRAPKLWILPVAAIALAVAVTVLVVLPPNPEPPAPAGDQRPADTAAAVPDSAATEPALPRIETPPGGDPAPDFVGIDTWLNSPPLTMEELRGKVVLVDFWTYS